MGKTLVLALSILLGTSIIAAAVVLRPTGFQQCIGIVSDEIESRGTANGASIDPRDVEFQAAQMCAGSEG